MVASLGSLGSSFAAAKTADFYPADKNSFTKSRPSLDDVLQNYQVQQDEMVTWSPNWVPFGPSQTLTKTEAALLDKLQFHRGLMGLQEFKDIRDDALAEAIKRYPAAARVDGHGDAFRHAYWNALMTREFGNEFAQQFATAHEGSADTSDAEAMDLYNNEVGRRIAMENPDASPQELADLVQDAIENGEMVVIDKKGELAWSNEVAVGQTGRANDPQNDGGKPLPKGDVYPDHRRY